MQPPWHVIAKRACLLLFTVPLGCGNGNNVQPIPGPGPTDAGADAPVDAALPAPVTGTQLELCPIGKGLAGLAPDLPNTIIQAWVADPTEPTGFRLHPGIGHSDGTFEILGVPDGVHYLLQLGSQFFVTDQKQINANFLSTGRCAPQFTFTPVPVTFAVTNMSPFGTLDSVGVFSFSNAESEGAIQGINTADTSVSTTFNWTNDLPVAALGDDITLLHSHADVQQDDTAKTVRQFDHIVDVFTRQDIGLTDGPATVSGAFTPTTTATVPIVIDAAPYVAPYQAESAPNNFNVELNAGPFSPAPLGGGDLGGISVFDANLAAASLNDTITYADPFPASWQRAVLASGNLIRFYAVGGTMPPFFVSTGGEQQIAYTGTPAPTFAPMIPPATGLKINGVDVNQGRAIQFDSKSPIKLSWQAAAGASLYTVIVWQVNVGTTVPTFTGNFIGNITTPETSVVVPASLLITNRFYAFEIVASDQPGSGYASGTLSLTPTTFRESAIASARLRFSATCGDGVTDPGEDCDDKGESKNCNADCTKAVCGDGILNTTAGETCDTIFDTATCASATCSTIPAGAQPAHPHVVSPAMHRERATRLPVLAHAAR